MNLAGNRSLLGVLKYEYILVKGMSSGLFMTRFFYKFCSQLGSSAVRVRPTPCFPNVGLCTSSFQERYEIYVLMNLQILLL